MAASAAHATPSSENRMVTRDRLGLGVGLPPTILVFDSGLGGLTVLREIVRGRVDAQFISFADDTFFPYGRHSEEEIIARVVPLVGELIAAHRPDLVVIACNTMSVSVMAQLRAAYRVPF